MQSKLHGLKSLNLSMNNQKNLYRDCLRQGTKRPPYLKRLDLRGILGGIIPLKNCLSIGFAPPIPLSIPYSLSS
jgi:hypothetical protein